MEETRLLDFTFVFACESTCDMSQLEGGLLDVEPCARELTCGRSEKSFSMILNWALFCKKHMAWNSLGTVVTSNPLHLGMVSTKSQTQLVWTVLQLFFVFCFLLQFLKAFDCFCCFRAFYDGRHFRVEQFEDARNPKGPALRPVPGMVGYLCPQKLTWKYLQAVSLEIWLLLALGRAFAG